MSSTSHPTLRVYLIRASSCCTGGRSGVGGPGARCLELPTVQIVRREQREAFITADGSSIRELAGVPSGNTINQSLAEAVVPAGGATVAHFHRRAEELYLFTGGRGRMRLGNEERPVRAGDCVVIPPGTQHKLWADPGEPLVLLCCCAPAYSNEDTVLLEG